MPRVTQLSEVTSRVIAPNPGHMTLDGTNTYVVALPGSGAAIVVDPGPDAPEHRARVGEELKRRDVGCELVVVTHHHLDHAEAARRWADGFGCPLAAPSTRVVGNDVRLVLDADHLVVGELRIDAVSTPGHCADHTAYRLPDGTLLSGDHVLGRGTSVVAWPEGDLAAYLSSLGKVLDLGPDALYPGHGPAMEEDPASVIQYYLEHRAYREAQVVEAMAAGVERPGEMVRRIYADVDELLWPAAELSTRAALAKLVAEGRATGDGDRFRPLT
jgi:glyoxylase-like metal-dependent hydrolase (beta-lactamase superfamily II)